MNKILTMILQRFGLGLVTLFVVSAIIFLGVEFLPGDIAEALLGQGASPKTSRPCATNSDSMCQRILDTSIGGVMYCKVILVRHSPMGGTLQS